MSFVQRLRMANMFPVNSNFGEAQIPVDRNNDMMDVINAGRDLFEYKNRGLANVGQRVANPNGDGNVLREPLRFGGVTEQSNPGADILNRSRQSANSIYESYKKPQVQAEQMGPSNDVIDHQRYLDNALKSRTVDANIGQNERRIANDDRRLDQADDRIDNTGWTVGMIDDPKNPDKQISVRINSKDGRVEPIKMEDANLGNISKPGTNKGLLVQPKNLDGIRQSTQETLNQLDEIIDEKGNFSQQGGRAVGGSALGNNIPFTDNWAGRNAILRLKSLLVKDLIGEMKNQSRTGATGYGALNLGELNLLKQGADKLDTLTDEETFRAEAGRIREKLNKILQDETPTNTGVGKPAVSHTNTPPVPKGFDASKFEAVRRPDNKGWTFQKKIGDK